MVYVVVHSSVRDVLRGLTPVPDEEVLQLYGGTYHVPLQQDSGFYGKVRRVLVMWACRYCPICQTCVWFGTDGNKILNFVGFGTSIIISSDYTDTVWD